MDIESPLRTIASPVEAEALRILAGADTEFSVQQLHRLANPASLFGMRKALTRLADAGLVDQVAHGRSNFYRGNRSHVLWPAVESAVAARVVFLERLRASIARRSGLLAYLYGSVARGESVAASDVDVLLIFDDGTARGSMADVADELSSEIRTWTGNEGQIYSTTRSELRESVSRADPIVDSFRRDAIALAGPPIATLLASGEMA
ncbi:nucleotidyltransferase domain-containing protein [Schumannella sp. 10F1B-5-1]|uniref:nucleotidyltransferase domain-containing protein n=1 Tax=Schumannella sp. 10F1B-5-1 TaxID=2590780 RepID=UPI0011327B01|nr:nucleotidyltransferase domain-containing protein [Schumannella sp. 10F1B-5-1]TPW72901.1 nucleotidyltransferase domain-containing protein [Schumannella sp. 10F1B-5-1]